jgi:hypothetical protein
MLSYHWTCIGLHDITCQKASSILVFLYRSTGRSPAPWTYDFPLLWFCAKCFIFALHVFLIFSCSSHIRTAYGSSLVFPHIRISNWFFMMPSIATKFQYVNSPFIFLLTHYMFQPLRAILRWDIQLDIFKDYFYYNGSVVRSQLDV